MTIKEKIYFVILAVAILILWVDIAAANLFFQEQPYPILFTVFGFAQFLLFRNQSKIYTKTLLLISFAILICTCLYHFHHIQLMFWGIGFMGGKTPLILYLAFATNLALTIFCGFFLVNSIPKSQIKTK
jgi:hypothetical protein